jgi:hypothetical protein
MDAECNNDVIAAFCSLPTPVRTRPMAPVAGVHHQHSNGLGLLLRSVERCVAAWQFQLGPPGTLTSTS